MDFHKHIFIFLFGLFKDFNCLLVVVEISTSICRGIFMISGVSQFKHMTYLLIGCLVILPMNLSSMVKGICPRNLLVEWGNGETGELS